MNAGVHFKPIWAKVFLLVAFVSFAFPQVAGAGSVRLAWDPNTEFGLDGYRIYYGRTSGQYNAMIDVGNKTSYDVSGLDEGNYYFALKAYGRAGEASDFSNEVAIYISTNADRRSPLISNVSSSRLSGSRVTVTWVTDEPSDSQVDYGITAGYGNSTQLNITRETFHSQTISGLVAGTQYYFRVKSGDVAGNLSISADYTFVTSSEVDGTAPLIDNVTLSSSKGISATVTWRTDEISDSQVEYGTTESYGNNTTLDNAMATLHSRTLMGLIPNTMYHYRVKSRDSSGNLASSRDYTFETLVATSPPEITGITVSNITSYSATISWTTDKPSDSEVEYRISSRSSNTSALRALSTKHFLTLNHLQKNTLYYFRVKSAGDDGNQTVSMEDSFRTMEPVSTTLVCPRFSSGLEILGVDAMAGIAVANLDSGNASFTFTSFDYDGILTLGRDVVNPSVRPPLVSNAQLPIIDWEIFGAGLLDLNSNGWIKMESDRPNANGFFVIFDSGLSFMDGANMTDMKFTDFVFPELQTDGYNKISIINDNTSDTSVTLDLMAADGAIRDSQIRSIKSNGALTVDLFTELFGGMQPDATNYVRVKSSGSVHSFQVARQNSSDVFALAGQDLSSGGTILYAPQFVIGGSWRASLSIINLDSRAGMVTLQFINEDGIQIGATRATTIPANGKLYIEDPEFFLTLSPGGFAVGYLRIVSDAIRLSGSVVFGEINRQSSASALALISSLQTSVLYSQVASNDIYYTGIAILNPNSSAANVTLELFRADGTRIAEKIEVIKAHHRQSRVLVQYFPLLEEVGQTGGYVRLRSDLPIASFAVFGTNTSTALSAIPPQIVQ
jgi:hypothetical protein